MPRRGPPLPHLPAPGVPIVLCHLRAHGPVCAGERGGGRLDETPGGKQQGNLARERVCFFLGFFCFPEAKLNKARRALLQEAKEDAEIDAEIALEMAMESQRRLSTASNNSSGEGTYVGPCPHSPGQVGGTL